MLWLTNFINKFLITASKRQYGNARYLIKIAFPLFFKRLPPSPTFFFSFPLSLFFFFIPSAPFFFGDFFLFYLFWLIFPLSEEGRRKGGCLELVDLETKSSLANFDISLFGIQCLIVKL